MEKTSMSSATGTAAGVSSGTDNVRVAADHRRFDGKTYGGHADFYRREYAPFITREMELGTGRGSFVLARQSAGDFSDAAVPDHVFVKTLHTPVRATYDFGYGRRRHAIKPASVGFVPAMVPTSILVDDPHEIIMFALPAHAIPPDSSEDLTRVLHPFDGRMHESRILAELMQAMLTTAEEGPAASLLLVDSLITAFLAAAIGLAQKPRSAPSAKRLADWQIRRACALIGSRLAEQVTLQEVADEVGLSQYHFCRAFKASTGLAPHQYQVALRIERAKDLLRNAEPSITDIASIVGYDHAGQLSRVFRKALGMTPSAYRRAVRT